MNGSSFDEIKKEIRDAIQMGYIVPEDIPAIELYMDQVTTFMEQQLSDNKRKEEDKILTKTMINNYTKNHVLPPPEKKKYTKDHIILLIYIYYLKNFFSIGDIQTLLEPMVNHYFGADRKDDVNLSKIYSNVVELAMHQYQSDKRNIFETYKDVSDKVLEKFQAVESKENLDYIQDFTFVAMLSYDIYLKTQLVEHIIDGINERNDSSTDKSGKR